MKFVIFFLFLIYVLHRRKRLTIIYLRYVLF